MRYYLKYFKFYSLLFRLFHHLQLCECFKILLFVSLLKNLVHLHSYVSVYFFYFKTQKSYGTQTCLMNFGGVSRAQQHFPEKFHFYQPERNRV